MPTLKAQSQEVLNKRIEAWAKLYGRNLNEEAVSLLHRLFDGTEPSTLAEALDLAVESSFHMPTPAKIRTCIGLVIEKRGTATGVTDCDCKACGGIGHRIVIRPSNLYPPESPHHLQKYAEKCPCHPAHRKGLS